MDFHFHIVQSVEGYRPWILEWMQILVKEVMTPQGVLEVLDERGIDYAVVLADVNPISVGVVTNEHVAQFCKASERLIPFANINPFTVTWPDRELERCVKELGMRGLKLTPTHAHFYPNDSRLYPMYAKAQEMGIPVMFHTGSSVFKGSKLKYGDPLYLDDLAVDFPDLVIVQAHSGRGFWYDRAAFLARLHPNVYMEIAGLPPQKLLDYFPELERLADKMIFGSDCLGCPTWRATWRPSAPSPYPRRPKPRSWGRTQPRFWDSRDGTEGIPYVAV